MHIFYLVISVLFIVSAIAEIKRGRLLLRPEITRDESPIWFWVEIIIFFVIAGYLARMTFAE